MCKNKKNKYSFKCKEILQRSREILIAFEENMFPLPKPYVFRKNKWKERDFDNKKFMPKIHKLSFLEEYDQVPLSEK